VIQKYLNTDLAKIMTISSLQDVGLILGCINLILTPAMVLGLLETNQRAKNSLFIAAIAGGTINMTIAFALFYGKLNS
jgi:hypothetical protein